MFFNAGTWIVVSRPNAAAPEFVHAVSCGCVWDMRHPPIDDRYRLCALCPLWLYALSLANIWGYGTLYKLSLVAASGHETLNNRQPLGLGVCALCPLWLRYEQIGIHVRLGWGLTVFPEKRKEKKSLRRPQAACIKDRSLN
eukprot:1143253-Pelagomonas_calceolata.AAC.7